jgi:hypothetical protein
MFLYDQGVAKFITFDSQLDITFWDIQQQVAWVSLKPAAHRYISQVNINTRLCYLEILDFDSWSHNFSRVILDSCYPKFQFDGRVTGGGVHPSTLAAWAFLFLIGRDRLSSLPVCLVQPIKIWSETSSAWILVTRADVYLQRGTWLEDSENYTHRGYMCSVSPITRLFSCLSCLSN